MDKEDRASIVELRRFTNLLNRLQCVESEDINAIRRRICFVQSDKNDNTGILELAQSGNVIVDKCVMTFASLVAEVDFLSETARNTIYPALLIYGEDVSNCLESEGGAVKMVACSLPFLQELSVFVSRCYEVFRNIVLQIYNFFQLRDDVLGRARDRKVVRIWRTLGNLLSLLIFLDEIIQKHPMLLNHWARFLKSIQSTHHNPSRFGADPKLLKPLQNVILQIDTQIMTGFIFKNCCQQIFFEKLHSDVQFSERMRTSILEMYIKWERVAVDDIADKRRLTVIVSLLVLHSHLFRVADKKLLKTVWNSHKRLAAFHIVGDIVWTPCDFLAKNVVEIEKVIDRKSASAISSVRLALIDQEAVALTQEVTSNQFAFVEWQSKMNEELREWPKENVHGHLMHRTSLFLKGMRQADLLSRRVRLVLCGSLYEKKPLSRSMAMACLRFIEIVKGIEEVFVLWWNVIVESTQQALQHWSGQLLRLVNTVKESLRSEANLSNEKVDVISALSVAEIALSGAVSRDRLIVTGIALEFACYTKTFRPEDMEVSDDALTRMDTLLNIGRTLSRICNCSFLFWHRPLISIYFESLMEESTTCSTLFFIALSDVETVLSSCRHAAVDGIYEKFRNEIFDDFEKRFLLKLCEAVETDLRLSIHAYLQPVEEHLSKGSVQDQSFRLKQLLHFPPLALAGQFIDIKRYAELHLERAFYNLTAVALHDCHTYIEMRLLACSKYDLCLCESRLPFQTLDQGLDVLLVTRNLHSFVSSYNYNLNAQFFIEKDSKNKHLNILTVEHVANSIRTHGAGIMNTVINFAYQYLKKKFYVFSQFLYDDHIKGQLIKEIRHFQANADQLNKMYPVKRAQRFNTAIRRLGVSDDGLSFLDKFRTLITQIGNVMGYVRLVRSGSIEACSQSLAFLPDLDDMISFASLTDKAICSKETTEAAKTLDLVFDETAKNVNQANNYLQILVEVFSKELRNFDKYDHLSNFYIIVPSLTINYTENILACKGKLGRRAQQNNTFTDDGFILGVAFILTMLDQVEKFESLNWFYSVENRCEEEFANAKHQGKSSVRTQMEPSVALRLAKLEHYQKEFRLLFYTFHSAKIFFKIQQGAVSAPSESVSVNGVSD